MSAPHRNGETLTTPQAWMVIPWKLMLLRIRRDYTCGTCEGEEIVQTTNSFFEAAKAVVGKLSRRLQVQVLPGAPEKQ
ncbi:MAG: hypothetical protein HW411_186 [Gammaproteobacteria bacterium]|nr:hypothetical protein [Gammaproteobacteria bacterium]